MDCEDPKSCSILLRGANKVHSAPTFRVSANASRPAFSAGRFERDRMLLRIDDVVIGCSPKGKQPQAAPVREDEDQPQVRRVAC